MTASNLPATTGNSRTTSPLPAWLQVTRDAVAAEIKDEDMKAIVRAFVEKAKKGDEKAAKFVIEYLMGAKHTPQQLTIENHYHGVDPDAPRAVTDQTPLSDRERIQMYLEAAGTSKPAVIAADLNLPFRTVTGILNHKSFRQTVDGWEISHARNNGVHSF